MISNYEDVVDAPHDHNYSGDAVATSGKSGNKKDKKKKDKKHKKAESHDEDASLSGGLGEFSTLGHEGMAGYGSVDDDDDDRDGDHEDQEEYEENQRLLTMAKSKYDMKNHMANERTFFKYLFTGLHIGGIGTLVLSFFATADVNKLYLVLFIWLVAFGFMFWGLYSYYRRKRLMETGHFKETQLLNPHTPVIITVIFVSVIALVVAYAMISNQYPAKGSRSPPLLTRTRNATSNTNSVKRTNVRANPTRSVTTGVAPIAGKTGTTIKPATKTVLSSDAYNAPTLELLDTEVQLSGSTVNTDFLKDKSLPPGAIVAAQLTEEEREYDDEEEEEEEYEE